MKKLCEAMYYIRKCATTERYWFLMKTENLILPNSTISVSLMLLSWSFKVLGVRSCKILVKLIKKLQSRTCLIRIIYKYSKKTIEFMLNIFPDLVNKGVVLLPTEEYLLVWYQCQNYWNVVFLYSQFFCLLGYSKLTAAK